MGEAHHVYKINGMYYILSADYSPMGRMQCARSKSIWGPYETCVISERESYGYAAGWSVGNMGIGRPLPEDGFKFQNNKPNGLNLGCAILCECQAVFALCIRQKRKSQCAKRQNFLN